MVTFNRIGRFLLSRLTKYEYQIGEIGMDICNLELDKEEKAALDEFVKTTFGEDAFLIGTPSCATMTFQIGSRKMRREYGEKLLAEGRESEAKSYLV